MNFTREPIIETVITPKEGYRLIVRSSKGTSQEEYSVDALEVISFGSAIFYRSSERPKPFLVPVADFEVVEVKETRVVLKNANLERSIKIGGGREAVKAPKEQIAAAPSPEEEAFSEEAPTEQGTDKKRERRHRRRRRGERQEMKEHPSSEGAQSSSETEGEGGKKTDEAQVSSPSFSSLFPPPTTLISQTIARYKDQALTEGSLFAESLASKKEEKKEKDLSFINTTSSQVDQEELVPEIAPSLELSGSVEELVSTKKKEKAEIIDLQQELSLEIHPTPFKDEEEDPT